MKIYHILLIFVGIASAKICEYCYIEGYCSSSCNYECPPPPENCTFGTILDGCDCCTVCAKGEGEICGGVFDIEGKCARELGLYCVDRRKYGRSVRQQRHYFDETGICYRFNKD